MENRVKGAKLLLRYLGLKFKRCFPEMSWQIKNNFILLCTGLITFKKPQLSTTFHGRL